MPRASIPNTSPDRNPLAMSCRVKRVAVIGSAALATEEDRTRQVVAFRELRRGSFEAHAALLEEHGAIRDRERDVERLLDDDDGQAVALQLLDDGEQLLDDDRRQAERELVDEQHVGIVQQ